MPLHPQARADAIEMLKNGHAPGAVYNHLVRAGCDPNESNACIGELLALKREAEARDPKRLREDAIRMLFQGAPIDYVVGYFASLGISEEHARPEVTRLADVARSMIACQVCSSPMIARDGFFDANGNQVCKSCNVRNELGAAQDRAIEAQKNERFNAVAFGAMASLGGGMGARLAVQSYIRYQDSIPLPGPTTCPKCKLSSGVNVAMLPPHLRQNLHLSFTYACKQCGMGIT